MDALRQDVTTGLVVGVAAAGAVALGAAAGVDVLGAPAGGRDTHAE